MTDETTENVEVEESEENGETSEDTTEVTREKKIKAWFEGDDQEIVCMEVVDGNRGVLRFDTKDLPDAIKSKMIPFATLKKLGSQGACAGKKGKEAEEAIEAVWASLLNGDWTLRQPAQPKVTIKNITANMAELSADEQTIARELLARLGLKI